MNEKPRMVIAKFLNYENIIMIFELFKHRNVLRNKSIRISNDLTYLQRQQVKQARQRGVSAYFKDGKLCTFSLNHRPTNTRIVKRPTRPSERERLLEWVNQQVVLMPRRVWTSLQRQIPTIHLLYSNAIDVLHIQIHY